MSASNCSFNPSLPYYLFQLLMLHTVLSTCQSHCAICLNMSASNCSFNPSLPYYLFQLLMLHTVLSTCQSHCAVCLNMSASSCSFNPSLPYYLFQLLMLHTVLSTRLSHPTFVLSQHLICLNRIGGSELKPALKSSASVIYDVLERKLVIKDGYHGSGIVYGHLINSVNQTGWAELGIKAIDVNNWNDSVIAYAAGLVEGYLTKELIHLHWLNTQASYCTLPYSSYCIKLHQFLQDNLDWIRGMIDSHSNQDPYWYQVRLYYEQISGLIAGYNNLPGQMSLDIEVFGIYLMQIQDDAEDLENVLNKRGTRYSRPKGHCSALIKRLPGSDILTSHDTWASFNTMLRVLKVYHLPYYTTSERKEIISGSKMSFSSYPGYLYSSDDYYITSAKLTIMETTNPTNNMTLFQNIKPHGIVLEGIRNQIANRLAGSGEEWVKIFSKYNSGTYNNQWMIVDYKEIQSTSGILTVLEQLPGYIHSADQTDVLLKKGYWSSYNRIYYPDVFNISGEQELVDKYGDFFTHDKYARALIFDRDQNKVHNIADLMKLMRNNDYQNDPLSRCNCTPPYSAMLAIMARGDLNPANGTYPFKELGRNMFGGLDTKVTSLSNVEKLNFYAQSGPTSDQVPAFRWSNLPSSEQMPHFGHPDVFDFPLILFNVSALLN